MSRREQIIEKVAKAAHDAHYCPLNGAFGDCENCREDGKCFELSGGFDLNDSPEWRASAEAAVETIEEHLGIEIN